MLLGCLQLKWAETCWMCVNGATLTIILIFGAKLFWSVPAMEVCVIRMSPSHTQHFMLSMELLFARNSTAALHVKIVTNQPYCRCPRGFRLTTDGRTCEDINECYSFDLGGCDHFCRNTIGSYYCICSSGSYLSFDGKTCKKKAGLACARQSCQYYSDRCLPVSEQYCFDIASQEIQGDSTFCTAEYLYTGFSWQLGWQQCIYNYGVLNDSCAKTDDTCILQQVYPDYQFYSCCCKTDFCNTNVVFPSHLSVAHPIPTIHSANLMSNVLPSLTVVSSSTITVSPVSPSERPPETTFGSSVHVLIIFLSVAAVLGVILCILGCISAHYISKK